jgi:hypothetical protein
LSTQYEIPPDMTPEINRLLLLALASVRRTRFAQVFRAEVGPLLEGMSSLRYDQIEEAFLDQMETAFDLAGSVRAAFQLRDRLTTESEPGDGNRG